MEKVKAIRVTINPIKDQQRSCMHGAHFQDFVQMLLCHAWSIEFLDPAIWEDIPVIAEAATLHDIGKMVMPCHLVSKKGKLTAAEFEEMKGHTVAGAIGLDILVSMEENSLLYTYAREICWHHHERVNGRGYPDGLHGEEIEPYVQVVSLADAYDALRSDRSYRKGLSHDRAAEMICSGECGAFDSIMFEAFVPFLGLFWEIARLLNAEIDD